MMELYILYRRVEQRLSAKGIRIEANWVGHYCTSLDMVGASISILHLDQELTDLLHHRMQHLLERVQDEYGPHPRGEYWVPRRLGGGAPTLAEAAQMDAEEAAERAARRARD